MAERLKKTGSILVRVEPDVAEFYEAEAKFRRVSVAHLVRELLYRDMAEKAKSKKENSNGVL